MIFDKDNLEWQCDCGRSVEEMGFSITYHYGLELGSNTEGSFVMDDSGWDLKSKLKCECGAIYTDDNGCKLDWGKWYDDSGTWKLIIGDK